MYANKTLAARILYVYGVCAQEAAHTQSDYIKRQQIYTVMMAYKCEETRARTDSRNFSAACAFMHTCIVIYPSTKKNTSHGIRVLIEYTAQVLDICTIARHVESMPDDYVNFVDTHVTILSVHFTRRHVCLHIAHCAQFHMHVQASFATTMLK
jgi:hypothetical protein